MTGDQKVRPVDVTDQFIAAMRRACGGTVEIEFRLAKQVLDILETAPGTQGGPKPAWKAFIEVLMVREAVRLKNTLLVEDKRKREVGQAKRGDGRLTAEEAAEKAAKEVSQHPECWLSKEEVIYRMTLKGYRRK